MLNILKKNYFSTFFLFYALVFANYYNYNGSLISCKTHFPTASGGVYN